MNRDLQKVVAITGASSGIGRATAVTLAAAGHQVVLGARNEAQLKEAVAAIHRSHGQAAYAVTDVTRRGDVDRLVDRALETYGRLDVIVNNAGVAELSRIDALDVEGWDRMIDVNLRGVLYGMAAALPVFRGQGAGHIVNVISTSGIKITPLQGVYAATKNAVRTLSECYRQESDGSIRITGISPGFVRTAFISNMKNGSDTSAVQSTMDQIAIRPEDVARAIAFAIEQPADVEIGELVVRPAVQD